LIDLGAPPEKVHYNSCGCDSEKFRPTKPGENPPQFVSVGRFVEKKAPQLTLLAFRQVLDVVPDARLRMIGEGPLLGPCRDLAGALDLGENVEFLGAQPHDVVAREMSQARAFVQHSVEASSGDCEGTPVAVLEAGASGLPVIATRHAGIPDVIIEEETGLLVEERDVPSMASHMIRLAQQPELASRLGAAARKHVAANYTMEQSIGRLWKVIENAISQQNIALA